MTRSFREKFLIRGSTSDTIYLPTRRRVALQPGVDFFCAYSGSSYADDRGLEGVHLAFEAQGEQVCDIHRLGVNWDKVSGREVPITRL